VKFKFNLEMLMAGAAMVTAVAAVVVAVIQTDIMREEAEMEREHARLSVTPSLWIVHNWSDNPEDPFFSIVLANKGLGPAIIEHFSVSYEGQPLEHWDDLVETVSDGKFSIAGENENINAWSLGGVAPGAIIPATSSFRPFQVGENASLIEALIGQSDALKVSVCFCSVYGDCWNSEDEKRPKPVDQCTFDRKTYFGDYEG